MWRNRFASPLLLAAASLVLLGASPATRELGRASFRMLRGKVGYPATEKYLVLEGRSSIFLIPTASLTALEKSLFTKIGKPVSIRASAWMIEYPFPKPEGGEVAELTPNPPDRITHEGAHLNIFGTSLPSVMADTVFVQSGEFVYQLDRDRLEPEAQAAVVTGGRVSLTVSPAAVVFAWRAVPVPVASEADPNRVPASKWDTISRDGDKVMIRGTAQYSPDADYFLIRSLGFIYQIRREDRAEANLPPPGSQISISVLPAAIRYAWKAN